MTTIVTPIQDELALAQAAYDTALQNLMKASAEFNDGAGKEYAELVQRHVGLRGKIATYEATAEAATAEFKQLLAASDYEKTKLVKDALFKKNDALAIAEELREALADSERTALALAGECVTRCADLRQRARRGLCGLCTTGGVQGSCSIRRWAFSSNSAALACAGCHRGGAPYGRPAGASHEVRVEPAGGGGQAAA